MAGKGNPAGSADIYDDLRSRLVMGGFEAGTRLRSEELRGQYCCSASTIREVLFRLSCDGFVEFRDQKGFRVPKTSHELLRQIAEMRLLFESEGARLSIANGDIGWEADLTAAHHKLRHIEEKVRAGGGIDAHVDVWCEAEWGFHRSLIAACGSQLLCDTHRNFYDRFRLHLLTVLNDYGFRDRNIIEHEAILSAALNRDAKTCSRMIEVHLMNNLNEPFATEAA